MGESLTAFGASLVLGVVLSRAFRRSLFWLTSRERKAGKERIHRLFPKPRRPLGGGLAILVSATIGLLAVPTLWGRPLDGRVLWVLPLLWGYGLIGLADDLQKVRGRGLDDRRKLALQVAAAAAFAFLLWRLGGVQTVHVPFLSAPADFGIFYPLFALLVIVATANAVNLSDGVDGLAGGAAAIALMGLAALGLLDPVRDVGPICWPLIGAVCGFLVYNLPPARLLMGDTGALALGAAIACLAIFARAELWLLLLGAPFVVNAASVVIQMGTVRGVWRVVRPLRHRTTETGRPFLCTPLHHHFQWLGWDDWRVLALFWGLGAAMSAWALLSFQSGLLWTLGLVFLGLFLVGAALQKLLRANYFLGLLPRAGQPSVLAVYRGLPLQVLSWPLYRVHYETSITEGMLVGATAESILWRPITEIEAHVVLGKIYADQKLFDEALTEWEQVPTRNLLLRPSVVLRLARIYYGSDRLLEAIKLWEQLPAAQLDEMPNLREVVRSAKLRLADLASKSHRQSMRMMHAEARRGRFSERLEAHLLAARRFNQDLLSLLIYESDRLRGRPADPQAARTRREIVHRMRNIVLERVSELDEALTAVARDVRGTPQPLATDDGDPAQRAAQELGVPGDQLADLLAPAGRGRPRVTRVALHPKASRNTVFRLSLEWSESGPATLIAKRYAPDRIRFFSACYRRERGVLELLHRYGCAVPKVYGGQLRDDQAVLLMQDLGDETLAERLEASDPGAKQNWVRSAVTALVALHAVAHSHLRELAAEIRKVDKERLTPSYYLNALNIAVGRVCSLSGSSLTPDEWQRIADQAGALVDFLADRPQSFIHFEFTPHHLLVAEQGLRIFDFEQATIGPVEFDLAALLAQPESDVGREGWDAMVRYYRAAAAEAGLPITQEERLDRAVAYAALFKCLVYAGAAANFLSKFGGEHHLQRFHYYADRCQDLLSRWPPLRPLGSLLAPRFRQARAAAPHRRAAAPPVASG